MKITISNCNCTELNECELVGIFGGDPSNQTGFWYDASYYIVYVPTKFIVDLVKYTETHPPVPRGEVY